MKIRCGVKPHVQETNTFEFCDVIGVCNPLTSLRGFTLQLYICSVGIILHFPALCANERLSLALICAEWLCLRQWFLMLVMQKRCAEKWIRSLYSSAWHCSQFMRLAHQWRPAEISNLCPRSLKEKKCFGNALIVVAHAPDVWRFVMSASSLLFAQLVCCTFNFCYSTPDFAHSRGGLLFGLSHTRSSANLIDNETCGHSIDAVHFCFCFCVLVTAF